MAKLLRQRYVVKTFVEASSIEEALKQAKSSKPQEVYLDDRVLEKRDFQLFADATPNTLGFKVTNSIKS